MLDKIRDLLLVLNMEGLNIVMVTETKYSRKFKSIYNTYRITVWEKYIQDHKAKHRPMYNRKHSVSEILLLLAEAIKQDNKKAFFKELSRSYYFEENRNKQDQPASGKSNQETD